MAGKSQILRIGVCCQPENGNGCPWAVTQLFSKYCHHKCFKFDKIRAIKDLFIIHQKTHKHKFDV